jgi:hypothetical protein
MGCGAARNHRQRAASFPVFSDLLITDMNQRESGQYMRAFRDRRMTRW